MTDLLEWAAAFKVPRSLDGQPRKARFHASTLPAPAEVSTDRIRVFPGGRRPNGESILIDVARCTADREAYRALGLLLFSHALCQGKDQLLVHLPGSEEDVRQIVLWPSRPSHLELRLGCQVGIREVRYRPGLLDDYDSPRRPKDEVDLLYDGIPNEHLAFCTLGPPGSVRFGPPFPPNPWCLHVEGTALSLVWLGRILLDLSLDDSRRDHWYFYNTLPAEMLAPGSAELELEVAAATTGEDGTNGG